MNDPRQQAAAARMQMKTPAEARMYFDNQQNAGGLERLDDNAQPYYDPAPLSEYPRMLYRKTEKPEYQEWADILHEGSEEKMVINKFDGLLCETVVAESPDEAEMLAAGGWDVSPKAAHGIVAGLVAITSAKDDEIAALRAELAARDAQPRRGRPPKEAIDAPADVE